MLSACPISGNATRLTAPSARMAAIAYEASSSSASMAPRAAMIAETPQIDAPIDNRLVSFGDNPKARPITVMITIDATSSTATQTSEMPPSAAMSPSRNLTPSRTMPAFSQNSYVSTPASNIRGTPTVFEIRSPNAIAQRTYSMFGSVSACARP